MDPPLPLSFTRCPPIANLANPPPPPPPKISYPPEDDEDDEDDDDDDEEDAWSLDDAPPKKLSMQQYEDYVRLWSLLDAGHEDIATQQIRANHHPIALEAETRYIEARRHFRELSLQQQKRGH